MRKMWLVVLAMALAGIVHAAQAAQPASDDVGTARLVALLGDEDPAKVSFALYQLAAKGVPPRDAVERLCGHRDAYVRRAAYWALLATREPPARQRLARGLRDGDAGVRRSALIAAMRLDDGAARALFVDGLDDAHPAVRELAAVGLGLRGDKGSVGVLVKALHDPSLRVRRAAAVSLGKLGDPAALEPLRRLRDDPEKGVDAKLERAVEAALDQGRNFDYEFLTLPQLIERFGADTGIPTFVTDEALAQAAVAAHDPDNLDGLKVEMWQVRTRQLLDDLTQAAGLSWYVDKRWVVITVKAHAERDTPLELEIAGALYRLGDSSARGTLRRYAKDPAWKARAEELLKKQ